MIKQTTFLKGLWNPIYNFLFFLNYEEEYNRTWNSLQALVIESFSRNNCCHKGNVCYFPPKSFYEYIFLALFV